MLKVFSYLRMDIWLERGGRDRVCGEGCTLIIENISIDRKVARVGLCIKHA